MRSNQAVARCDRGMANPAFSAEAAQRSTFLLDTYREQEAIVTARLDISQRRATLREAGAIKASDDRQLTLEEAATEDRQQALNDRRMLEGIRQRRDGFDAPLFPHELPGREDRQIRCSRFRTSTRPSPTSRS